MGSVFSPYYAWARRRGSADPEDHCALNVALYTPGRKHWAMTERGRRHCGRSAETFEVGPSALHWDGQSLRIRIDERSVPWARRLRGEIRVWPEHLFRFSTALDGACRHRWGPIAPSARVEVTLDEPALRWRGQAYLDSNEGDEPLSRAFHTWDWSRARRRDGSTLVHYDLRWPDRERVLSLHFGRDGRVQPVTAPRAQTLPRTAWHIRRQMRSERAVRVLDQLEDTPFYQRALLGFWHEGESLMGFHETLSVPRLQSAIVQAMLPWRMPRRS